LGAKEGSILAVRPSHDLALAAVRDLEHQVWRKGFGIEMAFELLLAEESEVRNRYVIIRSGCTPALSCLERDSSRSPKLQGIAE
jgi:hypothetical protein